MLILIVSPTELVQDRWYENAGGAIAYQVGDFFI